MDKTPKTLEQAIALIEKDNLDWGVGRYPIKDKFRYWGVIRSSRRRADSRGEHDSPLLALLDAYARYLEAQYPVVNRLSKQKVSQL